MKTKQGPRRGRANLAGYQQQGRVETPIWNEIDREIEGVRSLFICIKRLRVRGRRRRRRNSGRVGPEKQHTGQCVSASRWWMKRRDKSQHKFEICLGYPCFSLELTPNAARTLTVFSLQRNKEVLGDLVTSPAAARLKNGECSLPVLYILSLYSLAVCCACCLGPGPPHYKPPSEDVGEQPSRPRSHSVLTDGSCDARYTAVRCFIVVVAEFIIVRWEFVYVRCYSLTDFAQAKLQSANAINQMKNVQENFTASDWLFLFIFLCQ